MSAGVDGGDVVAVQRDDVDLEDVAVMLRTLADEVEPNDWMHDSRGRPL